MFECKTVITRRIADSLAGQALRMDSGPVVDIAKAKQQHAIYEQIFRDLNLRVIVLEADESLPDCVFVEDPAFVVGTKALITHPGHPSRQPECKAIHECLKSISGLEVFVMNEMDPSAHMDGGDVLYTGKEIFVGLSKRTNQAGYEVLRSIFQPIPVRTVEVVDALHLKSVVTLGSPGKLMVFTGNEAAKKTVENLKSAAQEKYEYIDVPGRAEFANCIYLERDGKGVIIHRSEARKAYEGLDGSEKVEVEHSELGKVDGCLTCSSLLLAV